MHIRTDTCLARILTAISIVLFTANAVRMQTPAPSPSPSPSPEQTIESLRTSIQAKLNAPLYKRGRVGIKAVSLKSGKVIFEDNADKYFMPASNMKNFTVAAALEKLTPDFRFATSVLVKNSPDANGVVDGNLRIYGRGDISISTSFTPGNFYKGIDDIVARIAAAGVKRINGNIIADDSYFSGSAVPSGWEWDDLQWYYGAEVSALPYNDNVISLTVLPGPSGYPCGAKMTPYNTVYRIKNLCMTTAEGTQKTLKITKALDRNELEISGTLPLKDAGFNGTVAISRPAEVFAALLKERLELKGITVSGQYMVVPMITNAIKEESIEIARIESPPLSLIAAKTMKPSQNMYTEVLLWTLGEQEHFTKASMGLKPPPRIKSAQLGTDVVLAFLVGIGIEPDAVLQYDGSGLSRHNLVTPSAVVRLYTYMAKESKFSQAWRDSLTIGGVDGTLARRFTGTSVKGNVRGKTGTIDQVSALSGYVTTAGGDEVVFSLLVNGVAVTADRVRLIDSIVLDIANFKGKLDPEAN